MFVQGGGASEVAVPYGCWRVVGAGQAAALSFVPPFRRVPRLVSASIAVILAGV